MVSFNLYRAADDVFRIHAVIEDIQKRHGIDKPIWLTETNAMPSDDSSIPCPHADTPIKTTMQQQAAYSIQAMAMAAAAGYQRYEFYQMVDQDPCAEPAVWGVTRDDGSRRPVGDALRTAFTNLGGFYERAQFVPYVREVQSWSPWPDDPRRWCRTGRSTRSRSTSPATSASTRCGMATGTSFGCACARTARARRWSIDRAGTSPAREDSGWWTFDLPGATAHYPDDPGGYSTSSAAIRCCWSRTASIRARRGRARVGRPGQRAA